MLHTFANNLNFTYVLREPLDEKWGTPADDGNWTGIVGDLQHQQADFSLDLTLTESRSRVMDHSRIYNYDPYVILSLKPSSLPRHLALTRPFKGEVWIAIIVCTPVMGLILWLLQKAWSWALSERDVSLVTPLFHTWGILLSEPSPTLPTKASGRVLMGWWLLTCVIITAAYHSSLIAHLSVQSKYPPINTFQDLLNRDGWSWGIYDLTGTNFLYFNGSSDPDIQEIYQHMQNMENSDAEEWLERVLHGGFSLLDLKTWIQIQVAKRYTDKDGNTPFHISTTEYPVFGGNVWGFRQVTLNCPFIVRTKKYLLAIIIINSHL
ncbi:probable glutamate receptor [Homarus americanus]|uniref:probable glutamate receptor n=1 Tax=Homarus americanus TaxID=6706 RepID=UPI001C452843|nr:probable glutamate receptor [Homarus americanus]